jgi:hypothetical protein
MVLVAEFLRRVVETHKTHLGDGAFELSETITQPLRNVLLGAQC